MKKVTLILIAFLTLNLNAQTSKEARALLEEVKAKALAYNNQKITFDNVLKIPNNDPAKAASERKMEGVITLKGEAYRLELNGVIYLNDTKKLYIIDPELEEIEVTAMDEEMPLSPTSILNEFDNGYSLKLDNSETINGVKVQYVKLKPTGASDVLEITLGINMKDKTIYSYEMVGMNKVVTILTIKKYETNLSLPANTFTFNEADWPDYYINN